MPQNDIPINIHQHKTEDSSLLGFDAVLLGEKFPTSQGQVVECLNLKMEAQEC